MAELGRLPVVGDEVQADGYRLAVTAVDGRRAARVLVSPPAPDGKPEAPSPPSRRPSRAADR